MGGLIDSGSSDSWHADARRLRAQGHDARRIAALLDQTVAAVREALREASRPKPPVGDDVKPLGAGQAEVTTPHVRRTPRVTLDRSALQAAAQAFASGEIDRAELMRRIAR
jgi:hypothetical protein